MKTSFALFRRKTLLVPTLWGWLILVAVGGAAIRLSLPALYRFLAVDRPVESGILAVEGWIQDHALAEAVVRFESGRYKRIYALGGPISTGAQWAEYGTLAEMTAERLRAEGLPADRIVSVSSDEVERDRTLASARALRKQLEAEGLTEGGIDLITVGPHARRSWLLFRRELAPWGPVGVITIPPEAYLPSAWWHSSAGFRAVVYEGLAYVYTLVLGTCQPASGALNSRSASEAPHVPAS